METRTVLSHAVEYLSFSISIALILGFIVGIIRFRQLSSSLRTLTLYMLLALVADITFRLIGDRGPNLFFIPIYALFELALLSYWYYHYLLNRSKTVIYLAIFTVFAIVLDLVFLSNLFSIKDYQSYGKVMADAAIIFYTVLFYWRGLRKIPSNELLQLNTAVLCYFTINFLMFASINFLVNASSEIITVFWVMNILVTFLFYSLITYRLWQHGKTPKPLQFG